MFSFVKHFWRFFCGSSRPDLFQCLADKFTFMTERIKGIQLFLCPRLLPTIVRAFYCITKYHFEVSAVSSLNGIFVPSEKFPASWKFNFTWNYTKHNSFSRLLVFQHSHQLHIVNFTFLPFASASLLKLIPFHCMNLWCLPLNKNSLFAFSKRKAFEMELNLFYNPTHLKFQFTLSPWFSLSRKFCFYLLWSCMTSCFLCSLEWMNELN